MKKYIYYFPKLMGKYTFKMFQMNVTNDPQFIVNLLDPGLEHNCYFLVGDPCKGRVVSILLLYYILFTKISQIIA